MKITGLRIQLSCVFTAEEVESKSALLDQSWMEITGIGAIRPSSVERQLNGTWLVIGDLIPEGPQSVREDIKLLRDLRGLVSDAEREWRTK